MEGGNFVRLCYRNVKEENQARFRTFDSSREKTMFSVKIVLLRGWRLFASNVGSCLLVSHGKEIIPTGSCLLVSHGKEIIPTGSCLLVSHGTDDHHITNAML
ncbi:unnamed protein product [Vicia faba]|uniref:Uncharacterized protein n=1 Tax=Vicia faba TaxID=3906 RepID=A0AAV1B306_VICFA|nr:unnamed protein product [Vicia faba]